MWMSLNDETRSMMPLMLVVKNLRHGMGKLFPQPPAKLVCSGELDAILGGCCGCILVRSRCSTVQDTRVKQHRLHYHLLGLDVPVYS